MNLREKLLLVARELSGPKREPFDLSTLTVAAWKRFQVEFGLPGYCDLYPDSNKVIACVVGERGMVKRGFLDQVGPRCYRVAVALVAPTAEESAAMQSDPASALRGYSERTGVALEDAGLAFQTT